jgi:hypothetical protein
LVEKQNAQVAVLPVHTKPERLLFKALLLSRQGAFLVAECEPDWLNLAQEWNAHGNGQTIFYQVNGTTNYYKS